ncbi:hypothetical protein C8J57DRAFT_1009082, partial [Mycena rebaudengoi]
TSLVDMFNLLSLFYLTISTCNVPATYSQIVSMPQILCHMDESMVYNQVDLVPFRQCLVELHQIVQHKAQGKHMNALMKLLECQLNQCDTTLQMPSDLLTMLSIKLFPIHECLVTICRQLVAAREGLDKAELRCI